VDGGRIVQRFHELDKRGASLILSMSQDAPRLGKPP
jgi:hypothetical protein